MGLVDVHSHLLPGLDDGCPTIEESIACARVLVENGYTHSFCTPHIWPNLPGNSVAKIPQFVDALQGVFDREGIALKLFPGGEMNVSPQLMNTPADEIVTFCMARKYALVDLWAERLPEYLFDSVRWLQDMGLTVILAHPERMRAIQDEPESADALLEMGVLLQGNLQCLSDPPHKHTRIVSERFLSEGKYFLLGSDLHNLAGLASRMAGLKRAREVAGKTGIQTLMVENPKRLLIE